MSVLHTCVYLYFEAAAVDYFDVSLSLFQC